MAEKWKLRKDTIFNTFVNSAVWNAAVQRWSIRTSNGKHFKAKFFLANTGFAAKRHTSDWKGLDTFKGTWFHPSYWPKNEPNVKGKRVAVIGTGATGIQVCQGLAPLASEFTLFQRTPNQALPMGQIEYKETEQRFERDKYAAFFSNRNTSFGGFDFNFHPKVTFDDDADQTKAFYTRNYGRRATSTSGSRHTTTCSSRTTPTPKPTTSGGTRRALASTMRV